MEMSQQGLKNNWIVHVQITPPDCFYPVSNLEAIYFAMFNVVLLFISGDVVLMLWNWGTVKRNCGKFLYLNLGPNFSLLPLFQEITNSGLVKMNP